MSIFLVPDHMSNWMIINTKEDKNCYSSTVQPHSGVSTRGTCPPRFQVEGTVMQKSAPPF